MASLPPYLLDVQREIEGYATAFGLDFWEVSFEVLDYRHMQEVASFGGFPVRYPHWRFGMDFDHLIKSHTYGLSKIYEMVINSNPAYSYLIEGNSLVDQKMVIAHVLAHVDFFKNNYYFSKTNRKMMDQMANHATRIRRHRDRIGIEKVESFIDSCLCLENLIDPMSPFIVRRDPAGKDPAGKDPAGKDTEDKDTETQEVPRLRSKGYMDRFINPPDYIEAQQQKRQREKDKPKKNPAEPERDVLFFLLQNAPLEAWEHDILEIIRDEAYYFAPQRQTKILNEGWAAYWHSKIMTECALEASEIIDYADHNAGILQASSGQLNPYRVGLALLRHIEDRWNKGRFGKEWRECEDYDARQHWDKRLGLGSKKIFEVRQIYNDVTFIDEFLSEDFCRENRLFTFAHNERTGNYEIESREFAKIKNALLFQLTNFGEPFILVDDANYENRGELLLCHRHESVDLHVDNAKATLSALERIWRRPVNLHTRLNGKPTWFRNDGKETTEQAS
jgi:stage V sporulation protein R